jgi:hypothetical protein
MAMTDGAGWPGPLGATITVPASWADAAAANSNAGNANIRSII